MHARSRRLYCGWSLFRHKTRRKQENTFATLELDRNEQYSTCCAMNFSLLLPNCDDAEATKSNEILRAKARKYHDKNKLKNHDQCKKHQIGETHKARRVMCWCLVCNQLWIWLMRVSGIRNLAFCGPGFWNCLIMGPKTIPSVHRLLAKCWLHVLSGHTCADVIVRNARNRRNPKWNWRSNWHILSCSNQSRLEETDCKEQTKTCVCVCARYTSNIYMYICANIINK